MSANGFELSYLIPEKQVKSACVSETDLVDLNGADVRRWTEGEDVEKCRSDACVELGVYVNQTMDT